MAQEVKQQPTRQQQEQALRQWAQHNAQNLKTFSDTQLLLLQQILIREMATRCGPFMPSLGAEASSIIIPELRMGRKN